MRKGILLELVQSLAEIIGLTLEDGGSGENKMTVTRVEGVARFIEIQNVRLRPPSNRKEKATDGLGLDRIKGSPNQSRLNHSTDGRQAERLAALERTKGLHLSGRHCHIHHGDGATVGSQKSAPIDEIVEPVRQAFGWFSPAASRLGRWSRPCD